MTQPAPDTDDDYNPCDEEYDHDLNLLGEDAEYPHLRVPDVWRGDRRGEAADHRGVDMTETSEPVERAAEFIWDYIHGNWGTYEDVQEMAQALADEGIISNRVEWAVKLTNDEVVECPNRADVDLFLVGYPKGQVMQRVGSGPWVEVPRG